ncbi:hypothetical protein LguiA_008007 [Lonicera macranthoides]
MYHRRRRDQETGSSRWDGEEEEEDEGGPFDIIMTKNAAVERLKRWRQSALVLNRSRRFRYTLDLKNEEEKNQMIARIRRHAADIRVKGLAVMLKTNEEKGIEEEEADLSHRRNVFGSNTYPRKKGHGFWRFLLDAFRDCTLITLMVAAAASFALGMKTKVSYR